MVELDCRRIDNYRKFHSEINRLNAYIALEQNNLIKECTFTEKFNGEDGKLIKNSTNIPIFKAKKKSKKKHQQYIC